MRSRFSESRRVFIHRLTFFGGGVVLLGNACKCDDEKPAPTATGRRPRISNEPLITSHQTFTNAEFATLSAACARVLPKDEDPGALEANVPVYIDRMLQSPDLRQMKEDFVGGIGALENRARRMFQRGFAELSEAQQDELITLFKDSAPDSGEAKFYELLVVLTLEGFLGDPSYGGNKDYVGWALVGFYASPPPPGYDGMKHLHAPGSLAPGQGHGNHGAHGSHGAHGGQGLSAPAPSPSGSGHR